ncbi:MAG: RNA polymerase sigma factor [Verrucomicrobiota bacterium]
MAAEGQNWCERLYDAKAAHLVLYGRALGLSHSEAEDVLQECFMVLLRMEETPAEPEHDLFRAYRNRALNYKRSLWRRLAREFESSRWFEREPAETDLERKAMRCLEQLPPEQREVIVLKIWGERTFEQIGKLLELSPNTVAGRYRYGVGKLRESLKGSDYEELEFHRGSIRGMGPAKSFA